MASPIVSVGVDLGGTWIRLEGIDARGHRVRSLKSPAPTLAQAPNYLHKCLRTWKARPSRLVVGSRGVWAAAERQRVKRSLRSLADTVVVMSDVEAAWYASFAKAGASQPHGVMVIAGTGSIVYGRDAQGHSARAGGLGPAAGDEGSAFWIGKKWLEGRGHYKESLARSSKSVRQVASRAPGILARALKGDVLSRAIASAAIINLVQQTNSVIERLHFRSKIPLSWGGSVMNNPRFRKQFIEALKTQRDGFILISPPPSTALSIAKSHPHL